MNEITEIKSLINNINERIDKLSPELIDDDKTKISLIINNLDSVISSVDRKFLLKQNTENVKRCLQNINSNLASSQWNVNDSYLYEILKEIAYFNNCNGKPDLRGYSKAVDKEVGLLESKIESLVQKINDITNESNNKVKEFQTSTISIKEKIQENHSEQDKKIEDLKNKYEKEIENLKQSVNDFKNGLDSDNKDFSSDCLGKIESLSKQIDSEITRMKDENSSILVDLKKQQEEKLNEIKESITTLKEDKEKQINDLVDLANEQLGRVGRATYSVQYRNYANKFKWAAKFWYLLTLLSMSALIGLSIYWLVITPQNDLNYISLLAKVFATFGVIGFARYCAIQASKSKTLETKLRKVELQMVTFDSFVATLDPKEQDRLKIKLAELLINQKDWLAHDKNELDVVNDIAKILKKTGHKIEINSIKKQNQEENNQIENDLD